MMKATHYYPDTVDFYEAVFVVQDGEITHYNIVRDNIWREVDKDDKYARYPKVEDLEPLE